MDGSSDSFTKIRPKYKRTFTSETKRGWKPQLPVCLIDLKSYAAQ